MVQALIAGENKRLYTTRTVCASIISTALIGSKSDVRGDRFLGFMMAS